MYTLAIARHAVAGALLLAAVACGGDSKDPVASTNGEPTGQIVAARGDTIVTMNIDGTNQQRFPGVPAVMQYGQHPTWASATRVLVHTRSAAAGPGTHIHALDLTSRSLTRVTPDSRLGAEWYPTASAGWVYFMGESANFEIWRMRPDGTAMAQVPAPTAEYRDYYRPVLSPDGSKLAVSTIVAGQIGVRVFDASSGAASSPWIPDATAPRWSPDSRTVAMSPPTGGRLRVMNADGSSLRVVSPEPVHEWFSWTADGNWLVGSKPSGLVLIKVADGTVRPIQETAGMWQPAVRR